jgi:hypothetical protein
MACPVTIHEVHQGVKQDKMFYQHKKDGIDFSEWNENVAAVTQQIILILLSMNMMFMRMLEKKLFVRNYRFSMLPLKSD